MEGTQATDSYYANANGVTYTLVKYTENGLYYTNSESKSTFLYLLPGEDLNAAISAGTWNSVTGNANGGAGRQRAGRDRNGRSERVRALL